MLSAVMFGCALRLCRTGQRGLAAIVAAVAAGAVRPLIDGNNMKLE